MESMPIGATLRWTQPERRRPVHQLRRGDQLLATMDVRGARATVTTEHGPWHLERDITRRLRVWDRAGDPVAELSGGSWSGRRNLTNRDGRVWVWEPANFWRTAWQFRGPNGPTVRIGRCRGLLSADMEMTLESFAAPIDLLLLSVVARFVMLLSVRDNADAAAGAIAGSMPPV